MNFDTPATGTDAPNHSGGELDRSAAVSLLLGNAEDSTNAVPEDAETGELEAAETDDVENDAEVSADAENPSDIDAEADDTEAEDVQASEADATEATVDDTPEPDETPEPRKLKVKIDGQELEVTEAEAVNGYQRQADYSRKTQELAQERKAIAELEAKYADGLALIENQIRPQEPNWDEVRANSPDEYPALYADWQRKQAAFNQVQSERAAIVERQKAEQTKILQETKVQEQQALMRAIPEWTDQTAFESGRNRIMKYATSIGYSEEEIGSALDHRAIVTMNKAALYDELMAQKPKVQAKIQDKPKTPKARARETDAARKVKQRKQLRDQVRKTGSRDDALRFLLGN